MMHLKYVNLLIKPVSSMCNLRCKYCFYGDEANNRMQHSMGVMREEVVCELIQQVFYAVESGGAVSFVFQGGEPAFMSALPYKQMA